MKYLPLLFCLPARWMVVSALVQHRRANRRNVLDALLEYNGPWLFWSCPNGCRGCVEWEKVDEDRYRATCKVCGERSIPCDPNRREEHRVRREIFRKLLANGRVLK